MNGQRTPPESAAWITDLLSRVPGVLPVPWRQLITFGLEQSASILITEPWQSGLDRQVLPVVMDLLRGGRHACWALGATETHLNLPQLWPAAARWHHDGLVAILAGWRRRLPSGTNLAYPLEANRMAPSPVVMTITPDALSALALLLGDYRDLPAGEALRILHSIPVGVWINT